MRFPFQPLADVMGDVYQRTPNRNQNGTYSHAPEQWQHVNGHPTGALSELTGIHRRQLYRWITAGIPEYEADRIAIKIGLHPSLIWSDWFSTDTSHGCSPIDPQDECATVDA